MRRSPSFRSVRPSSLLSSSSLILSSATDLVHLQLLHFISAGVKFKPEVCPIKSRKGDKVSSSASISFSDPSSPFSIFFDLFSFLTRFLFRWTLFVSMIFWYISSRCTTPELSTVTARSSTRLWIETRRGSHSSASSRLSGSSKLICCPFL